jgi:hypothetical protein
MYDYVLGPTPSQESERSCMIVLGPTPSEESEQSCMIMC